MSKQDQRTLLLIGGLVLGVMLLSDPRCQRGCRTFAGHLLSYGLDALI